MLKKNLILTLAHLRTVTTVRKKEGKRKRKQEDPQTMTSKITKDIKVNNLTAGSVIISTPTEVLFLCPPEIPLISAPPMITSAQSVNPKSKRSLSTLASISTEENVDGNLNDAENLNASRGVDVAIRESSCIT
jgi:hypothetical protein